MKLHVSFNLGKLSIVSMTFMLSHSLLQRKFMILCFKFFRYKFSTLLIAQKSTKGIVLECQHVAMSHNNTIS